MLRLNYYSIYLSLISVSFQVYVASISLYVKSLNFLERWMKIIRLGSKQFNLNKTSLIQIKCLLINQLSTQRVQNPVINIVQCNKNIFQYILMIHKLSILLVIFSLGQSLQVSKWMEQLPDDADTSTILYPGTHDSGTYTTDLSFYKCQGINIKQQLQVGIRYIDIRVKYCSNPDSAINKNKNLPNFNVLESSDGLCIYHGNLYLSLNFNDVLNQVIDFLKNNPKEFIIMRLQRESDGNSKTDYFPLGKMLRKYIESRHQESFWVKYYYPNQKLQEVRGKILALVSHGGIDGGFGINQNDKMFGGGDKNQYGSKAQWVDQMTLLVRQSKAWKAREGIQLFIAQSSGYYVDAASLIGAIVGRLQYRIPDELHQSTLEQFTDLLAKYYQNLQNTFDFDLYLKGIITMDFPDSIKQIVPIIKISILTQRYLFHLDTNPISFGGVTDLFIANKISIKSFHGTYLRGTPEGKVDLSYNLKDWEKWTQINTGQVYYWLRSFHDTYLSARTDGTLELVKEPKEWEQWTKIGNTAYRSFHGTYLSAEIDMRVALKPKLDAWEIWKAGDNTPLFQVLSSGTAFIKSFHKTYLSAKPQGKVVLAKEPNDWEKWTWLWLGGQKFAWKSFHNTYLSGRDDGSVSLKGLLQEWQIWSRVEQNGIHLWRSAHGTYLSAKPDFNVVLQKKPLGWEEWTEGDRTTPVNNRPQAPGTNLRIINNCPYTIWPGLDGRNNDDTRIFGDKNSPNPAGFQLKSGAQKLISLSRGALGVRVWARLRCSYQTNNAWPDVKTRFICEVGQCGNPLNKWDGTCFTSGGEGGNTLAQFTMTSDGRWYYDISLVDGYTVPVTVTPFGKTSKTPNVDDNYNCQSASCFPNQQFNQCPPQLKKFQAGTNTPISCYSISKAINDNDLKRRTPQLQGYFNDPKVRSQTECSCVVGSCAGTTANEVASHILPGTGFCCSPLNPLYLDARIKDHICYNSKKPMPLNNFGGGIRYDQIFKNICPNAYSWEFDDAKSTYQCQGKDVTLEVKFC